MANVTIMEHPLIQHKIGLIRRKDTGTKDFRQTISEIAMLICYEATRELKLDEVEIETPICKTMVKELRGKKMAIVPILRAGLGMVDGMLNLIPAARVGHIGLYRDPETLKPVEYYCKLPADCAEREVFVADAEGKGLQKHSFSVHHCRAGGHRGHEAGASRRGRVRGGAG